MTEAIVNVGEIFVKYGLSVEKVEPMVYKVLNQDKEVNVSRLQWDLRQCFLITPVRHKAKRMPDGYTEYYSKVYYVITECDYSLANKYEESLCGDVTSMRYRSEVKALAMRPGKNSPNRLPKRHMTVDTPTASQ